jgi:quinoprotein glucose dehydrogenase
MRALFQFVRSALFTGVLLGPDLRAQARGEWPVYGRDAGGTRFSPLTQITPDNVARLEVAWTFHTEELGLRPRRGAEPSLEVTPLVVDGTMYISTPLGRVIALDPVTGRERWRFDARVDPQGGYGDFTNRGVSTWLDSRAAASAPCRRRIYIGTIDARLIALDAKSGSLCRDFGDSGTVDLRKSLRLAPFERPAYQITSPPAVVRDLVISGSSIADNSNLAPASGEVRAFDARTGALRWRWDPIPQSPNDPAYATWRDSSAARTGAANVWSVIVADSARDLVFVPTSSPAPDYYGGRRLGANRYANSIVALRASTGQLVWHFQTVHHDLWDYDNASPPSLVTLVRDGARVPAVLQATKTGQLFVLHRETGAPLFGVEERQVPRSTVAGDEAHPTQPFTSTTPPLSPHRYSLDDAWGPTPSDRDACRAMMTGLRNEGIFTPPSLEGTLVVPSNIGGAHWGGVAADEGRGIVVVPVNRLAAMVQLIPADGFNRTAAQLESDRTGAGYQYTLMGGTPFVMRRRILRGPSGLPCSPPPFGSLVAVSLRTGQKLWDVPLGTFPAPPGAPAAPADWGSANLGGPIVTASGLVFIAATLDRAIRAFDVMTGKELWRADLPAGGKATPMTFEADGRQFVVIAAGGGGVFGAGDAIVAFALRRN